MTGITVDLQSCFSIFGQRLDVDPGLSSLALGDDSSVIGTLVLTIAQALGFGSMQASSQRIDLLLKFCYPAIGLFLPLSTGRGHDTMSAGLGATSTSGFDRVGLASNFEPATGLAGTGTLRVRCRLVDLARSSIMMHGCGCLDMLAGAVGIVQIGIGLGRPGMWMLWRVVLLSGMLLWRGKPDWIQGIAGLSQRRVRLRGCLRVISKRRVDGFHNG